jgi:hypothetical protein
MSFAISPSELTPPLSSLAVLTPGPVRATADQNP